MKCSNCGFENGGQAKFCAECGTRLVPVQDSVTEIEAVQDLTNDQTPEEAETGILDTEMLSPDPQDQEVSEEADTRQDENSTNGVQPVLDEEDWYYVKAGKSLGPYRRSVFEGMIASGEIQPKTYIWTKGMNEWTRLDNTVLKDLVPAQKKEEESTAPLQEPQTAQTILLDAEDEGQSGVDELNEADELNELDAADELMARTNAVEDKISADGADSSNASAEYSTSLPQWYYVKNSQTYGPYEQQTMIDNLREGIIGPNTYVWKDGMADWAYVRNTELAAWMHTAPNSFASSQNQWSDNSGMHQNAGSHGTSGVQYGPVLQPRSVIQYIILSVCTCGIFQICWIYMLARDLNILAAQRGKPAGCDPTISVILTLLSCGIYQVYYFWKEGTLAASLSRNGYVTNNSGILAILGLFLPIASCAILQDQLNTLITHD